MTTEEIVKTIVKSTYTTADIQRREMFLRQYLEQAYFVPDAERDVTKFLLAKHAQTDDMKAFVAWGDGFFSQFDKNRMYKMLSEIEEMIKTLPVVGVYVPYECTPAEIIKLGKWFRTNVDKMVIIDVHTDPTLLGGCAFVFNGVYRDYSLRYFMQKYKDTISNIIKAYVAKAYQN